MRNKQIKCCVINYSKRIIHPNLFQELYTLEISSQLKHCNTNPEFIVYHCPYQRKLNIYKHIDMLNIRKRWGFYSFLLMITGEYYPPPILNTDYNISFLPDSKNNFYLGLIPLNHYFEDLLSYKIPSFVKNNKEYPKKRFHNFIYSNSNTNLTIAGIRFLPIIFTPYIKEICLVYKKLNSYKIIHT